MKKQLLFPFFIVMTLGFIGSCHPAAAQTLVASYPLNGNANDVSGNGLNGIINGTLTPVADKYGNANSAMSFPGNGYISVADNALLRPGSISISCWAKVGATNLLNSFVDKAIGNCINDSWQLEQLIIISTVMFPTLFPAATLSFFRHLRILMTGNLLFIQ